MMLGNAALAEAVADTARRLHARGWVANHDGNVTARLPSSGRSAARYLATPTATSKRVITASGLIVVGDDGKLAADSRSGAKPFGEIGLHLTVYQNRADAHAVVHAHPPAATALACAGARWLEKPFIAEAVVSLGASIPTVPYAMPGAAACAALAPFVLGHDAVLLGNHGVLAWGVDLEQAFLRLELVEHLANIAINAERAGGVRPLPDSAIGPLLEARKKAGFVVSAPAGVKPVVACAPAPGSDVTIIPPGRSVVPAPRADLASVIREELMRALKD